MLQVNLHNLEFAEKSIPNKPSIFSPICFDKSRMSITTIR